MLHKCANPLCHSPFRSLSHGKLFLLETDYSSAFASSIAPANRRGRAVRRMERYWLCDSCSLSLTLAFERGRGMVTVPLPASNTRVPAGHLTQMQLTMKSFPTETKGVL